MVGSVLPAVKPGPVRGIWRGLVCANRLATCAREWSLAIRFTPGALIILGLAGCGQAPPPQATKPADPHTHSHPEGPHGGAIADWGTMHAEFTVDHDKQEATVYVLGPDAKTSKPVTADQLFLYINGHKVRVPVLPRPLEGEPVGKSSRFVGTDKVLGNVQEFSGRIHGTADGNSVGGTFSEAPHTH